MPGRILVKNAGLRARRRACATAGVGQVHRTRMQTFSPNEPEPITWIAGRAIHAAHLVVLVYVVSMIVTTFLLFGNVRAPFAWLMFDSDAVLRGEVWRVFTYALLNRPSLWFVIDMFLLAWFGRELERFFGRKAFLLLFAGLYLVTPVLFTALGFWLPTQLLGQTGALGMFIAFATLYPNVSFFFNLLAKWLAWAFVGIYTLIHLAAQNTPGLLSLWATAGFAFLFVRYQQGEFTLPRFRFPRRERKVIPFPGSSKDPSPPAAGRGRDPQAVMDTLLDKIARSGVESLTPAERTELEQARKRLLQRRS